VKSADERRRELLAAARTVFARQGIARATVDEITTTAGVAKGTFYRYFASKEAIVLALREEVGAKLLAQVAERAGSSYTTAADWWKAADALIRVFIDYVIDNAEEHRLLFHDPGTSIETPRSGAFGVAPALLRAGVERGVFATADAELTWVMLFSAIHGLADHALAAGTADRDEIVGAAQDLARRLLHPRPASVAPPE
jgi:AcrR family transcriptional regulator